MKKLTKLFVFFLFAFLLLNSAAFAQQKVVTSEGKYVLGLLDSKKDAKSLALMDAKGKAIEQAVAYLEGFPEVKSAKLTKDQINVLAISITSVDVQSEDWRTSGEIVSVIIPIRAIVDTSTLKDKIARMQEDDLTESIKEIQSKLVNLQKELEQLKASQQKQDTAEKKESPSKEQKPPAEVKPDVQPQAAENKDQPGKEQKAVAEDQAPQQKQESPEVKKIISNEEKQKYENVLKNVFALDCLEKGNIALGDRRWNDAQYVFSKAIELNPDLAEAYTGKSCALQNLNQPQEALKHVDTALKLNPQSARTHGIKALILKDQPGKIKQALSHANDAVKLNPDNSRLYRIRGEVYAKMGKPVLARKDFAAACNMGAKESCEKAKPLKQKSEAGKNKL
jgi:tetratricopeptide (TPR) repeat protein